MKRKAPCFLVLESYWSENLTQHDSVQPFIKGLCDLYQWEFHYRTFDSANDLAFWIASFQKIRRSRQQKIVYIASHGNAKGMLTTLEENIPLAKLSKALEKATSVTGLHLGACSLGKTAILKKLLNNTPLQWVAAYDQEVPWLESTALDLLFWSWIYAGAPRPKRSRRLTPEAAAHELYRRFNVAYEMGFRVIFRGAESEPPVSSWDTWEKSAALR
ncbi:hypothetical protein ACFL6M_01765 [Candidatus Eisenbacteria bacterium]|uniref:DUF4347 domain-containing protein n=1 Tax=Eiseniibacteriota bacterium TaxID=2212470 RepID=A0ABV6YIZ9_UNCEI